MISSRLKELVIDQFGDNDYFNESAAEDITNHGADSGWTGFTYYSDTVPFGQKIRSHVKPILEQYSEELGNGSIFQMMAGWKCLNDYTPDEIADGWYSTDSEFHTAVMNSIAWFALEEVAREVSENTENEEF